MKSKAHPSRARMGHPAGPGECAARDLGVVIFDDVEEVVEAHDPIQLIQRSMDAHSRDGKSGHSLQPLRRRCGASGEFPVAPIAPDVHLVGHALDIPF